jgi:hypothetical protein
MTAAIFVYRTTEVQAGDGEGAARPEKTVEDVQQTQKRFFKCFKSQKF